MRRPHLICVVLLTMFAALALHAQPFATGFNAPMEIAFTHQGNLIVAESGTGPNSGRISLVDRESGERRTLIAGLPSGIHEGPQPTPSGPSGLALQGSTLYVVIGNGDSVLPGPLPGSELPNPAPSSPILSSILSLRADRSLDLITGGFMLTMSDQEMLSAGSPVTLENEAGETMTVGLVVDFPDFVEEPRDGLPENVRASNPFGIVAVGEAMFVVDASLNLIRRVSTTSGTFATVAFFEQIANPTPEMGGPFIDAVPDSISVRGNQLVVTTLTGFPFPQGAAEVRTVDINSGAIQPLIGGLTSALDAIPLGSGPGSPLLVLEFSTNQLQGAPGRVRLVQPGQEPVLIAGGLITPTSIALDPGSGELYVSLLGPGIIERIDAAANLPPAAPAAIVPVVAATEGAFGSRFRTEMQIGNPHPFPISGTLRFLPQGQSGVDAHELSYSLAPFETRLFSDIVTATGGSGLGSLDIVASGGVAPSVVVHAIDDASPSQPVLNIPLVTASSALVAGSRGTLITPSNVTTHRFNVGIRTLDEPVVMTVTLYSSGGMAISSREIELPPHFIVQNPAEVVAGLEVGSNQQLAFSMHQGSAIIYGSAVSNTGQGSTLQIAASVVD